MQTLKPQLPIRLDNCTRESILSYFQNAWELEDLLLKSITDDATFYLRPDPLRNPLIFYLGHSAVFYINKLMMVNLLEKRINPHYEKLFAFGVDPKSVDELNSEISHLQWPKVADVWEYRDQVYQLMSQFIENTPLELPILQDHPLWALMMGIEHQYIHFETSSMLFRQLPIEKLARPHAWQYAPYNENINSDDQTMIEISGGKVKLGKSEDFPLYGWDSEYGEREVEVGTFWASKYMITNAQFLEFVKVGGYENQGYWAQDSWEWKNQNNVKHPRFWVVDDHGNYKYRSMFDEMELPLDWPVEVNHYEAMAYCRWQGEDIRLMTEAEWQLEAYGNNDVQQNSLESEAIHNYNLNLKFGSPTPVGLLKQAESRSGLYDLRGNVWEWLNDDFNPLPGFKTHFLYENYSTPYFDDQHKIMLGGAWSTSGTEALKFYRNWFRPNFYQHAGFRIAKSAV